MVLPYFLWAYMGSVCGSLLNPPAVPLESSGKVMEMGEHPPSQWGPPLPPRPAVNVRFHNPGYGVYGYECVREQGWGRVKSVEVP